MGKKTNENLKFNQKPTSFAGEMERFDEKTKETKAGGPCGKPALGAYKNVFVYVPLPGLGLISTSPACGLRRPALLVLWAHY